MNTMKKLYLKLLLIILPIIAYFILFLAFDVNDFSGLRNSVFNNIEKTKLIAYDGTKIVDSPYSIIKYINNLDQNIKYSFIFGDSRVNGADVTKMSRLDGKKYINLAFGGCSLKESIDEFWIAISKSKPERVIFEVDYYSINEERQTDRIKQIINMSLIQYFFDYTNNKMVIDEALLNLGRLKGKKVQTANLEPSRFDAYLAQIRAICANYKLDKECLQSLMDIADYCNGNKIDLMFYVPPVHKSIYTGVISYYGIDKKMDEVKKKLSEKAPVLDMQYLSKISNMDELWGDGHHVLGALMRQIEKNMTLKSKTCMRIMGRER